MPEQSTQPRIAQLADLISSSVSKLQEILSSQNAPFPSFDEDAALELPKEGADVQDAIIDSTTELRDLLLDPVSLLLLNGAHTNRVCLQAITRFKIAGMVPANGQVSYASIAAKTCMSETMTRRIIQYAMMLRVFREPEPGMVAHTKASRVLANHQMNDWLSSGAEDGWPSASRMVDALERWPKSQEPNETGFALANNTEDTIANNTSDTIYEVLAKDPVRAQRFVNSMVATTSKPEYDAVHALVKKFDNLTVIVQDLKSVVDGANEQRDKLPREVAARLSFKAHDFFEPQTVQGDVFFLRWILHNWSDKYGVLILRALIRGLRDGSRVVIMDPLMQDRGVLPLWKEKITRIGDMTMGALLNAQERTASEWKALITKADRRFELREIIQPRDSAMALLDIRWNGPTVAQA
ncbi:sterigmatocystin 8-O-methyltransferase [Xylariaceae sp. FL0594]|nr:sterigmatocystin 8-O-methyltransferase [Xylariaceae sp. FL0594]